METKQCLIVRRDLKMRRGKEIAQCAHASMKVFFDRLKTYRDYIMDDSIPNNTKDSIYSLKGEITKEMAEWKEGIFTKITCYVNSEAELLALRTAADELDIPNAIIQDCGKTEFHGIPTYTALAIGPDECSKIDSVTKHLPLY